MFSKICLKKRIIHLDPFFIQYYATKKLGKWFFDKKIPKSIMFRAYIMGICPLMMYNSNAYAPPLNLPCFRYDRVFCPHLVSSTQEQNFFSLVIFPRWKYICPPYTSSNNLSAPNEKKSFTRLWLAIRDKKKSYLF